MKRLSRALAVAVGVGGVAALWECGTLRVVRAEDRTRMSALGMRGGQVGVPTIQVYSRETVVDVTVLDGNDGPVHGLKQSDFTVEEDGKAEAIRSFAEFGTGAAVAPAAAEKLPANVYTNRQATAARGALNIIVLDSLNLDPTGGMRAKKEVTDYIRKMPSGTRVALLTLGNELKFVQGFTTDREVLIAALNDMKNTVMPPGVGIAPCNGGLREWLTLIAMRQIGALVEHAPGRKNVLWFTGDRSELTNEVCPGSDLKKVLPEQTLAMLAAARVSLFTIDTRGLVNPVAPQSAEYGETTPASMIPHGAYTGLPIDVVASATGGRPFGGSNDFQSEIGRAIEDGSNYYSITYVPAHGDDGSPHHIAVKVNRPGLALMYRHGYGADDIAEIAAAAHIPTTLDASTPEPEKNTMSASMARFAPVATQVLFDVKMAAAATPGANAAVAGFPAAAVKDKPMVRYELQYSVPTQQIALHDGEDGMYHGSLEFDVVASDVFGKLLTSVSRTIPLTMDVGGYADFVKQPLRVEQEIDLPAGQTYVRIGVLDKVSNKVGTVEVPVTVAKTGGVVRAGAK